MKTARLQVAGVIEGPPGENGKTPHIGENGNWYVGDVDTGKPSRGENGNDYEHSEEFAQLAAQIREDKESVDKTAQDFELTAQQALIGVNNTGQAQTERVQTAGNTAVENIKTAQNAATQAVETAKAEAIKTVVDKGKEVLETIPDFNAKLETKLDKNQGAEHAGKALVIGEDGNVVPGKPQTEGVGDAADAIVNTVSGTLLNIKDSAERKNKGFEMSGKTTQDGTPTPDAPVEIVNAGRLNEDTGKYEIDVKITGKNIVNIPDFGADTPDTVKKCYISKNICISAQEKADVSKSIWRFKALHKDGTMEHITDAALPGCFYATEENPIVSITYRAAYITSGAYKGIMVEYGTVATPYEPYKEQTLTLTSDRPLTKWDRLVEQDGQIGWLYASKYIENLAEIIRDNTPIYGTEQKYFNVLFENEKFNYSMEKVVSETGHYKVNKELYTIDVKENTFLIKINADDTIQTAKEHLHYSVMYNTTQTEFVPLPQEQQEAIRALQTYYPTTVVSNSEDAEMELSYVADTKNFILGIAESFAQKQLETSMLLLERTI